VLIDRSLLREPSAIPPGLGLDVMNDLLQSDRCAQRLKVIADPDRLKIVQCLRSGSQTVTGLATELDQPLAKVSHHLKVLRESGFVLTQKRSRFVSYSLNPEVFIAPAASKQPSRIDFGCCRLELP
jgi:ArsR family transcriptional regulator